MRLIIIALFLQWRFVELSNGFSLLLLPLRVLPSIAVALSRVVFSQPQISLLVSVVSLLLLVMLTSSTLVLLPSSLLQDL